MPLWHKTSKDLFKELQKMSRFHEVEWNLHCLVVSYFWEKKISSPNLIIHFKIMTYDTCDFEWTWREKTCLCDLLWSTLHSKKKRNCDNCQWQDCFLKKKFQTKFFYAKIILYSNMYVFLNSKLFLKYSFHAIFSVG